MRKTSTLLALALALAGCGSKKPIEQAPQAVQTEAHQLGPDGGHGALRFSAVVEPDARVPVSFRIPGYVTAIKQTRGEGGGMRDLAEGDRVSTGTVLVRIRSAEYEDKVQPGGLAGGGRRGARVEGEARLRARHAPLRQPRASPRPTSTARRRSTTRPRAS